MQIWDFFQAKPTKSTVFSMKPYENHAISMDSIDLGTQISIKTTKIKQNQQKSKHFHWNLMKTKQNQSFFKETQIKHWKYKHFLTKALKNKNFRWKTAVFTIGF